MIRLLFRPPHSPCPGGFARRAPVDIVEVTLPAHHPAWLVEEPSIPLRARSNSAQGRHLRS